MHAKIQPFSSGMRSRPPRTPPKPLVEVERRVQKQQESWEWIEKVLWVVLAGMAWITGVMFLLESLRFPFHLHRLLVAAILFVPVFLLIGIFAVVDCLVRPTA